MIKFKVELKNGGWMFGFGITDENIERLKENKPIRVEMSSLGEDTNDVVVILYGKTEGAIFEAMVEAEVISPDTKLNIEGDKMPPGL